MKNCYYDIEISIEKLRVLGQNERKYSNVKFLFNMSMEQIQGIVKIQTEINIIPKAPRHIEHAMKSRDII